MTHGVAVMARFSVPLSIACVLLSLSVAADDLWSVEVMAGNAHNFQSHLRIEQSGEFAESLTARYATHAFETPLYYSVRFGRWHANDGWELQLIHHKLYLRNPPAGVESLSISHGFNIITINRLIAHDDWQFHIGAGPVVTHAEGVVNGRHYDGPYELCGAALIGSLGRQFRITRSFFVNAELSGTLGYAAPSPHGTPALHLKVSNAAVHGLIGFGANF